MVNEDKAVSEGASSEEISSNLISETGEEDSIVGMITFQSFKRALIDMKN